LSYGFTLRSILPRLMRIYCVRITRIIVILATWLINA